MRHLDTANWDDLHTRMLRNETIAGALALAFQILIVAGLFFGEV